MGNNLLEASVRRGVMDLFANLYASVTCCNENVPRRFYADRVVSQAMRIAIATDAWHPQINGVARTLSKTTELLTSWGHEVLVIDPSRFNAYPLPGYKEISVALLPGRSMAKMLDEFAPEAIHLSTEGPIGQSARRYCRQRRLAFTTAYHTQFPEYVRLRYPVPLSISYRFLRWFHGGAVRTMVATQSMQDRLEAWGFVNLVRWSRGVDTLLFHPGEKTGRGTGPARFFYLGRVAVEKNIEDFLRLDLPGEKHVIGDGPDFRMLAKRYPQASFHGYRVGEPLAALLRTADVLVFPSLTDTFGLVMLEAMASGVPVAAYPAPGPVDVIKNGINGWIDNDLQTAALAALEVSAKSCRAFAEGHSWHASTEQFLSHLAPLGLLSSVDVSQRA